MPNENPDLDQNPTADQSDSTDPVKLSQLVNQVVSSHIKRSLAKEVTAAVEAAIAPFKEKLTAPPPSSDDESGVKKKSKVDPEVAALQAQLTELKDNYAKAQAAQIAAEQKQRDVAAMAELRSALAKHVRPEAVDMVTEYLYKAKGVITFDEAGTPLFKSRRAPSPGLAEEDIELPLTDGVQAFLKTREAAAFLPAPPTAGAPPVPQVRRQVTAGGLPKYDQPAVNDAEKIRRAAEAAAYMKQNKKLT